MVAGEGAAFEAAQERGESVGVAVGEVQLSRRWEVLIRGNAYDDSPASAVVAQRVENRDGLDAQISRRLRAESQRQQEERNAAAHTSDDIREL